MTAIDLTGLRPRPAQTWGAVRLVPLVRDQPVPGLRLDARAVGRTVAVPTRSRSHLIGYVPHAYVATWTTDGSPAASYGTQLLGPNGPPETAEPTRGLVTRVRSARDDAKRLRFLPLAFALEGLLGLEFGGPPIAWAEFSRRVVDRGLSPRSEASIRGAEVPGLEDALRTFEIHAGQCGVLVYVADQLLSAFVVPHPGDYRALHASLLLDLYGDVLRELPGRGNGLGGAGAGDHGVALPDVDTLDELAAALRAATEAWSAGAASTWLAGDLLGDALTVTRAYRMGDFELSRFLPSFERHRDNHLGETITAGDGTVAYLHTYRLSMPQVRRGRILRMLGETGWDLTATARALDTDRDGLLVQLTAVGLGDVIRQDVMDAWRARRRRG